MLERLRALKEIDQLSSRKLIQLYICFVRQVMEYSSLSWKSTSSNDLHPLKNVQTALAHYLGAPGKASREDLKVVSGFHK